MTKEEFLRIAALPYPEALVAFAAFSGSEVLRETERHFGVPDAGKGWYMHPEDHQAALRVLLGREPTWMEVWTSLYGGSGNIDAAWRLQALAADGAPVGWESFNWFARRLYVLRFQHPFPKAAAIAEDRRRDPRPQETARLMAEWDEIRGIGTPAPPPQPSPAPETLPPVPMPSPGPTDPEQRVGELLALLEQDPPALLELLISRGLGLLARMGSRGLLRAGLRHAVLLYRESQGLKP